MGFVSVLVLCCYLTNYPPKLRGSEQQSSNGLAGPLLHGLARLQSGVRAAGSSDGSSGTGSTSREHGCGQDSASESGSLSPSRAAGRGPRFATWQVVLSVGARGRQSSSSCRWHVTGFPHFVSSKHVTGSSPHSRGGRHTRTYTPRGRTPGNHPRRLPTTLSCEDSSKGIHCRGGAPWLQSASFHSPTGPFRGREESIRGDKDAVHGLSSTHSSSPRLTPLSAALSANSREK